MKARIIGRRNRDVWRRCAIEGLEPQLGTVIGDQPLPANVHPAIIVLLPAVCRSLRRLVLHARVELVPGLAPGPEARGCGRISFQRGKSGFERFHQATLHGEQKAERLHCLEPDRLSRSRESPVHGERKW